MNPEDVYPINCVNNPTMEIITSYMTAIGQEQEEDGPMEESDYNPLMEIISQKDTEISDLQDQVNELQLQVHQLEYEKERLEDAITDIESAIRKVA